ncbi:MAG: DUF6263 family protein [Ferruginibacter sp.]
MKKIILGALFFTALNTFAQQGNAIVLKKGEKISVTTTNSSDADVMGMQMKNNFENTSIIEVDGENANDYSITSTLLKLKLSLDGMGQSQSFDSENEADQKNPEMKKMFSDAIGKKTSISLNKFTGIPVVNKAASPEKPEDDAMEGLMTSFGSEDPTVNGAFLVIPAGKKAGDSWTVKDSTKENKNVITYTIDSLMGNIAKISMQAERSGVNNVEGGGESVDMAMTIKSSGNITADKQNGLVSERSTTSDISGSMEVQGQTIPVSGTTTMTSRYTTVKQ